MKQQLEAIRKAALDAISDAGKAEDLEALRVRYLGKKGELTAVLKQMGKLSAEERPVIGQLANDVRAKLEANNEEKAKELADKYHMAVLAPMFPGGLIQRDDFNSYKLLSCDGIRYDLILLDMIEDMAKRYPGVHTDQFFMFGHSGGGQFVNRFLLAHPDRLKACSIGAPGRPTFLNPDEDYFWGIRDFKDYFGYDVDLEAVKKVPVLISVGELDNKFIGDSPYGDNRVARMKSLQKNFQEHGVHTELTILPGFAHEAGEKERVQAAQKFFIQYL